MIVKKQTKKVSLRLFGEEAKQLAETYPDVIQFFKIVASLKILENPRKKNGEI